MCTQATITRPFCAFCIQYIAGRVEHESIDGIDYIVCERCATDEPDLADVAFKKAAEYSLTTGAVALRERRADRERRGVCIYSDNHGKATHGRTCSACSERGHNRKPKKRKSALPKHVSNKNRRELNKQLGRCINHPTTPNKLPHAAPVNGQTRCQACIEIHARSR